MNFWKYVKCGKQTQKILCQKWVIGNVLKLENIKIAWVFEKIQKL